MTDFQQLIIEELERIERQLAINEAEMNKYEKGSVQIRIINDRKYIYLKRRDGQKVKQKYMGPYSDDAYIKVKESIERNRILNKRRKEMIDRQKELSKALKATGYMQ